MATEACRRIATAEGRGAGVVKMDTTADHPVSTSVPA
jgi:hypothetical protein